MTIKAHDYVAEVDIIIANRARHAVANEAIDVEECRLFLDMLGLLPSKMMQPAGKRRKGHA